MVGKDGSKFDAVYTALYLDTGESMEFLETQIAETIADSHKPVERIFLYCDIVGTRFQVEKGMATEIALQAIQYIDEHYPTLGDYRVGVTDNDNKRPCLEFITTGKDITDSTHRFFVGVAAEADVQVPVIGDWRTDPDPRDKNTLDEIMTHNASLRIFWGGDETIEIRVSRDKIAEHMRKDGAFWMPADHNGAETFFRGMIFTPEIDSDAPVIVELLVRKRKARAVEVLRELETNARDRSYWPELVGSVAVSEALYQEHPKIKMCKSQLTKLVSQFATPSGYPEDDLILEVGEYCRRGAVLARVYADSRAIMPEHALELLSPTIPQLEDDKEYSSVEVVSHSLKVAKSLWTDKMQRELRERAHQMSPDDFSLSFAALKALSLVWQVIADIKTINVNGQSLSFPDTRNKGLLWGQAMELADHQIAAEALAYFRLAMQQDIDRSVFVSPPEEKLNYAKALAAELIKQAQQNQQYAPEGAFRLAVPAGTGVNAEDVRIWLAPGGMWVLPSDNGLLWWDPAFGLDYCWLKILMPDEEVVFLNLFLSALWHDLLVGGDVVVIRSQLPEPVGVPEKKPGRRHRPSKAKPVTPPRNPLRLPGKRVVYDGYRTWGSDEERELIKRRVHQVRGHGRKLNRGQQRSLYALDNARRFNFIIPTGYTFVIPHRRGLDAAGSDQTAPETPIVARGLASLIAALE